MWLLVEVVGVKIMKDQVEVVLVVIENLEQHQIVIQQVH
jgi:hypothetical protein